MFSSCSTKESLCTDSFKSSCCALQADDGYLYPLEKGFFYVHKPPTLLVYDEVEGIEFTRHGAGVLSNSAKTFDLAVRMKHDQVSTSCAMHSIYCMSNIGKPCMHASAVCHIMIGFWLLLTQRAVDQ